MNRATLQSGSGFQPLPHFQRPRAGMGLPLTAIKFGETIAGAPARKYKHPWWTTPSWSGTAGKWVATVEPGFVNGEAPVYRATVAEQKAVGNPWEINPLTGEQFFSASIFAQQSTTVATQSVDLPLYLNPAIPLDLRGLGFDGDPNASVPQFFLNLGVAAAPPGSGSLDSIISGDGSAADQAPPTPPPTPPPNLRLLRACDLWINQPRAALTSMFAAGGLGGTPYIQQLGVDTSNAGNPVRILEGTIPPSPPPPDPTQADYTEQTFDQLLISTAYLLSPPNAPLGSVPDATWQPYVRHNLFWNLNWAQPEFQQPAADVGQIAFPPLAGGAASLVIGLEQSLLADAAQTALNILLGSSLAGTFWTPTGGGSSSQYSVVSNQSPTGPDRTKNAQAALAAARAVSLSNRLDPDFPYNAQPFPTAFLATQ